MRGLTIRLRVVLGLLLVLLVSPVVLAQDPAHEERLLKAAFIYNFAKFTRWPEGTWADEKEPINLCIAGSDELIIELERLGGKTVKGRSLVVSKLHGSPGRSACHIVYIATSERTHYQQLTQALQHEAVLTVSEIPNFSRSQGIIELLHREGRVRFIINLNVARRAGLELSSRLLKLAVIVGDKVAP